MKALEELKQKFLESAETIKTAADQDAVKLKFLGRKGLLAQVRKNIDFKTLSPEERGAVGKGFNDLKDFIDEKLQGIAGGFKSSQAASCTPEIDITLPGLGHDIGSLHPITLVQMELEDIFMGMGFYIESGFDVETEHYNFEAVNIPGDHPAREMQDTFWLKNGLLLRTQTSANQVRALEKFGAPIKAIFPGRCFRYENIDASHENTFYQLEGLVVDRHITVANLISVMNLLLNQVFHREVKTRLRPGFFPFVEPGFELDINCLICGGSGCKTCKQTGWIELLPCGVIHPNVLKAGGIDPDEYSGFAFGLGLTRLAMMKYGIPDIRLFNSGDIRMLEQFPASV